MQDIWYVIYKGVTNHKGLKTTALECANLQGLGGLEQNVLSRGRTSQHTPGLGERLGFWFRPVDLLDRKMAGF